MKRDIRECEFGSIAGWRGDSLCCPQAFGGDIFSGCSLNCWFCFCREMESEMYQKYYDGWSPDLVRIASPDSFKELFDKAFATDKKSTDWMIQCLRYGLPFNMGSKAETFAYPNEKNVIAILNLFREYRVPVIFETKTIYAGLDSYLDVIKDLKAAVIVSIMGGSDTLNYVLEPNAPPASTRWQLVEHLNRLGIWCGVRWEPLLPTINTNDEQLEKYAQQAQKSGARHVSLYHYRSSNFKHAKEEFEKRGFNFIKMLEHSTDEFWKPIGLKFFSLLKKHNVPASSPDFVNFPLINDRISCCGTDEIFKPYKFNFQYALHLIKTKGKVSWSDMEEVEFKEPKSYERMKSIWNGGGGYFNLKDCSDLRVLDVDTKGKNIYGAKNPNSESIIDTETHFNLWEE